MADIDTNDLVEAYMNVRNSRDQLKLQYEEQDRVYKNVLTELGAALLNVCNSINADSIKTQHGTVMRQMKERYTCSDWDSFYKFVLDTQAVHLLERRVHQGNMKTYIEENSDDGLPPGTSVMREYEISVRKPSK